MNKTMKIILGVDPGKTGAVIRLTDQGLGAWKMPATERDLFDLFGTFGLKKKPSETKKQKGNRCKARAQELFRLIKITHAIADALLIAEYGRRTWKDQQLAALLTTLEKAERGIG